MSDEGLFVVDEKDKVPVIASAMEADNSDAEKWLTSQGVDVAALLAELEGEGAS